MTDVIAAIAGEQLEAELALYRGGKRVTGVRTHTLEASPPESGEVN